MESNKTTSIKQFFVLFLPLFLAIAIQYTVRIVDIIVLFLANVFSADRSIDTRSTGTILTQAFNQPINLAYIQLGHYLLYVVLFGIWYHRQTKEEATTPMGAVASSFKAFTHKPKLIIGMIFAGICGEFFVLGALALARPYFVEAFAQYDALIRNVLGASGTVLSWITVIAISPFGEELLFRGVLMNYLNRISPPIVAVLTQALLFAVYHGNVIQGIYAFILGAVLGLVVQKSKSLWPAILMHMTLNACNLIPNDALYETLPGQIITTVVALALFICAIVFAQRNVHKA